MDDSDWNDAKKQGQRKSPKLKIPFLLSQIQKLQFSTIRKQEKKLKLTTTQSENFKLLIFLD